MKFQKGKLVMGWGINDADYHVLITEKVDGKSKTIWKCPYYIKWYSMLNRCFSKKYQKDKVTYINKIICEEWKYFSNFRSWMEKQDWEDKCLDKDLLVYHNNEYSPETCCFISNEVNGFLTKRQNERGKYPLGVSLWQPKPHHTVRYSAKITKRKLTHLGYYLTPECAHRSWQLAKIERAKLFMAEYSKEPLTVKGLQRVIDKIQYDYDNNLITEDF